MYLTVAWFPDVDWYEKEACVPTGDEPDLYNCTDGFERESKWETEKRERREALLEIQNGAFEMFALDTYCKMYPVHSKVPNGDFPFLTQSVKYKVELTL